MAKIMDSFYTEVQQALLDSHFQAIRKLNELIEWHRDCMELIENNKFKE